MKKDGAEYLKVADPAKLKLIKMFEAKVRQQIDKEPNTDVKFNLTRQATWLFVSIQRDMGDYKGMVEVLSKNIDTFEFSEDIAFLAEILQIDQVYTDQGREIESLFLKILEHQLKKEKINLNYNMQKAFLSSIFKYHDSKEYSKSLEAISNLKIDSIDKFITNFEVLESSHFILRYLKVMSQYIQKFVVVEKDKFKSKTFIILILDVLSQISINVEAKQFEELLPMVREYVKLFITNYKNTMTIADELLHLYKDNEVFYQIVLHQFEEHSSTDPSNASLDYQYRLVKHMNRPVDTEESLIKIINEYLAAFAALNEDEKAKVEKGDRMTGDMYLFAACEYLRVLRELVNNNPEKVFSYNICIFVLLHYSRRSPYNFDLLMRLLEVNNILGFYEDNIELYQKHDLKGNQGDTLSYLFFKEFTNVPLTGLMNSTYGHIMDFYRECERETLESYKNCCKHGNPQVLWEFYLYERLAANSVNRIVVDHVYAEHLISQFDKKQNNLQSHLINSQYLLDVNSQKLRATDRKLAFNADLVRIQLQPYFSKTLFNFDLIGNLKDQNYLKAVTELDKALLAICTGKINTIEADVISQVKTFIDSIELSNLLTFDDYYVFRRVNNPTTDLKDKEAYSADVLKSRINVIRLALDACLEFVHVCLAVSGQSDEAYQRYSPLVSKQKLVELQALITSNIEGFIRKDGQGIDTESHFVMMHGLHRLRMIASVYSIVGQDIKAACKKVTKEKPEEERENIKTILSAFGSTKEFIKEKEAQATSVLKPIEDQEDLLKLDWVSGLGIKWPESIQNAAKRLTDAYNYKYKNSRFDIHNRLVQLSKGL